MQTSLTPIEAIRKFFEPPPVTFTELKALDSDTRHWIATECARELGATLKEVEKK